MSIVEEEVFTPPLEPHHIQDSRAPVKDNEPVYTLRHECMGLYLASLPLVGIFLLDVLPSRATLIFVGQLTQYINDFDAIFLAYSFTNFFSVFVLSLSCGLDTLSKEQLRNLAHLRHALFFVILGVIPYLIAACFAEDLLHAFHQPPLIINKTSHCIKLLIPYAIGYVLFAMLRKSLLQYIDTLVLISLMFARFILHCVIGYILYCSTDYGFYSFIISDSISMLLLLFAGIYALSRVLPLVRIVKQCFSSQTGIHRPIMKPLNECRPLTDTYEDITSATHHQHAIQQQQKRLAERGIITDESGTPVAGSVSVGPVNASEMMPLSSQLKEYIMAAFIPGSISCLEWWAVEVFTFLVGATRYETTNTYVIFFVHSCWSSILLICQMPMLGMSVAMAAMITAYIRRGQFYPAWYTLLQAMGSVLVYGAFVAAIVVWFYQELVEMFLARQPNEATKEAIFKNTLDIIPAFIIAVVAYSVAMCFLGIFVSVGRLARGGIFMLLGYYVGGLLVSVLLGFVALRWKLYGIWFGFACGFVVWSLLSLSHWMCTDWFQEMSIIKSSYDDMQRLQNAAAIGTKSYGSIGTPLNVAIVTGTPISGLKNPPQMGTNTHNLVSGLANVETATVLTSFGGGTGSGATDERRFQSDGDMTGRGLLQESASEDSFDDKSTLSVPDLETQHLARSENMDLAYKKAVATPF